MRAFSQFTFCIPIPDFRIKLKHLKSDFKDEFGKQIMKCALVTFGILKRKILPRY